MQQTDGTIAKAVSRQHISGIFLKGKVSYFSFIHINFL